MRKVSDDVDEADETASCRRPATQSVGYENWQVQSLLAQPVGGWQWVRLAHLGTPSYLVLLKISPNADAHDAVRALEWWLLSPGREDGDVIEVM